MKYKIIIWQYKAQVDSYESNDIKEILEYYNEKWRYVYEDLGGCYFDIFKDNKELSYNEKDKLGFY